MNRSAHIILASCAVLLSVLYSKYKHTNVIPVVIWWTPLVDEKTKLVECNLGTCCITNDRSLVQYFGNLFIAFYGSSWDIEDLPLPKNKHVLWALLHEESPKNQPIFNHKEVLSLFNFTSTFKQSSNMPLTLQYLQSEESLISIEVYTGVKEKNSHMDNLAPVFYLQNDCNPPSERDYFVKELGKFINIDSYGKCLNNKTLPRHLLGIENMNEQEIHTLVSKYKFSLAIENYACDDYVTEKLWRPMVAGSVPIYWGAPNINEWLPNQPSIINIRDYQSPKELSDFLKKLLENDSLYEIYLLHKTQRKISNTKLLDHLKKRSYGVAHEQLIKGTFVEHFECALCDYLREISNSILDVKKTDVYHYGCPPPTTVLGTKISQFWTQDWHVGKAEGIVLLNLIRKYPNAFNYTLFQTALMEYFSENKYFQALS